MNTDRRIRRLRALADGYRDKAESTFAAAHNVGTLRFHDGKIKERARIVAKLRLAAENEPNARCSILDLADEIERGE